MTQSTRPFTPLPGSKIGELTANFDNRARPDGGGAARRPDADGSRPGELTIGSRALALGTAVALTLGLSGCAAAEQPRESLQSEDREDNDEQLRRLPAFRALDTDDDGHISAEEIEAASESLASLDDNGDGRLSGDELQPRPRLMFGSPANLPEGTRVITLNADGDDSIEVASLPPELRSLLSPADADGDGTASAAELLAAMMAAQGGEPRGEQENAEGREVPAPGTGHDDESPQVPIPLMATFDTDLDGTVSETEIESAAQSLRKRDRDGDGRISPNEFRPD